MKKTVFRSGDEPFKKACASGIPGQKDAVKVYSLGYGTEKTLINLTIRTVRLGSIVHTDELRSFDYLVFGGYRHITSVKVHINGVIELIAQ